MRAIGGTPDEPTTASVWQCVAGSTIDDRLLEWPPDVFALTETLLERSEAYRFALSPPDNAEWPPSEVPWWPDAVVEALVWRNFAAAYANASPQEMIPS